MRAHLLCALAVAGVLMAGCLDRDLKPLNPCTVSGVVENVQVTNVDKVDMLFMIDNSNSMTEEQASLAVQLPRMMTILATGDLNPDDNGGVPEPMKDFPPVRSLQVGVVTSDMGTGGFAVPTCNEPNFGDDGVLRMQGNTALTGCMASYPSFLEFMPATGDATTFASDFRCVAQTGTGGCGFEQQLEAVLKALTPASSGISFNMGTSGHGEGANAGFLRPDSLLAIILLTDEEDCSAADPELFNPTSGVYTGNLNLRCFSYPAAVHPIQRFVDGFLALRDNPDLLVYAAITGVPVETVPDPASVDYDAILAHDLMQEMVDPMDANRLRPSCNVPGRGVAFPPRRIVSVAKELEARDANATVQSICQENFGPALEAIIAKIANALKGACLPRQLIRDAEGEVGCDVVETLPLMGDFTTCESVPGRTFLRTDEEGRQVCTVNQLAVTGGGIEAGAGWFYEQTTDAVPGSDLADRCMASPQRISYTAGDEPKSGTAVRLECLQPVAQLPGVAPGELTIGSSCAAGTTHAGCGTTPSGLELSCDATTLTCQQGCSNDAQCEERGLAGWRCDVGGDGFCKNPTCSQ